MYLHHLVCICRSDFKKHKFGKYNYKEKSIFKEFKFGNRRIIRGGIRFIANACAHQHESSDSVKTRYIKMRMESSYCMKGREF